MGPAEPDTVLGFDQPNKSPSYFCYFPGKYKHYLFYGGLRWKFGVDSNLFAGNVVIGNVLGILRLLVASLLFFHFVFLDQINLQASRVNIEIFEKHRKRDEDAKLLPGQ